MREGEEVGRKRRGKSRGGGELEKALALMESLAGHGEGWKKRLRGLCASSDDAHINQVETEERESKRRGRGARKERTGGVEGLGRGGAEERSEGTVDGEREREGGSCELAFTLGRSLR